LSTSGSVTPQPPGRTPHRSALRPGGETPLVAGGRPPPPPPAGVDVTYTRWPRMWHDFALQPGLLAAADSALAQAAWFVQTVTGA